MSRSRGSEWLQGLKESGAGIEVLRSFWPRAFPQKGHLVRPLSSGLVGQIAERTGWSHRYTRGVLQGWKQRRAYCEAVLQYDHRWSLDGEEIADAAVEEGSREQARRQLAAIAARRLREEKRTAEAASGLANAKRVQEPLQPHSPL
jgi:sRNA-binding protein